MNQKVENLKGKLIVSCQALSNEPLHSSFIMGSENYFQNWKETTWNVQVARQKMGK